MTERKVCGFDLNGWRDFVAKNWSSIPGEEEQIGPIDIGESGPLTSVVQVGEGKMVRWVGGPQADLAPHGLGGGWGEIGRENRRVSVRDLLEGRDDSVEQLSAAFDGLARGAAYNVVAIDDGPANSELVQEHLLNALTAGKYRNTMLVWRPVLAALQAIEEGLLTADQHIGVVCHAPKGLSFQKLHIRRAEGGDTILAPERREVAELVTGRIGYASLVRQAREAALGPDGLSSRTAHRAIAKSVGNSALGLACFPEVLRLQNGGWEVLEPKVVDLEASSFVDDPLPDMSDCEIILVETLAEGHIREATVSILKESLTPKVIVLEPDAVARGAVVAARRLGNGDPVYFDFLPRLSTIIFSNGIASNFDLIDADETLEAGRVYRSPQPASFAIPAGKPSVSIYLRKEAEPFPRMATVLLEKPLSAPVPVALWVEQTPAAGRARIVLEARDLGHQFTIDWGDAVEDQREWDEILASFEAPPPSFPDRLVLKCGLHPWEDSDRSAGLSSLLDTNLSRHQVDWDLLAKRLSSRPFGEYCISSDGEVPLEVTHDMIQKLDELTKLALEETAERLSADTVLEKDDNAALRFLTWQFRRCPNKVVDWLIDCIERRDAPRFQHPFVEHQSGWILVYQGLGRVAYGDETERRIIRMLMSTRLENWGWRSESACMAFLLSRSDSAPLNLEHGDVEKLVHRAIADFRENLGTEYNKFFYAPFLAAGLLRWRMKEPQALLLGHDPLALSLYQAIEDAERDFTRRLGRASTAFSKKSEKYLPILSELKAFLEGTGGSPDLLLDIYGSGS